MRGRDLNSPDRPRLQRGTETTRWRATRAAGLMAFFLVLPLGGAQDGPTSHIGGLPQLIGQSAGDSPLGRLNDSKPDDAEVARRIRMLNAERQRSLVADTVKLLKLANELNATMAKEGGPAPTQVELRKVADIERLARNVKEKMKITVTATPTYRNPTLSPVP